MIRFVKLPFKNLIGPGDAKEFRIKDTAHITEMKGADDLHKLETGSQRYAIQT